MEHGHAGGNLPAGGKRPSTRENPMIRQARMPFFALPRVSARVTSRFLLLASFDEPMTSIREHPVSSIHGASLP
jgi:hypothetical protein